MILLEELEVYKLAIEIGDMSWDIVMEWDDFARKNIGDQLVRSADSIALNIAEGYGRFHYKENKHFCFYARGSLIETKTAIYKGYTRKLINENNHEILMQKISACHRLLNAYIKSIGNRIN